MTNPTKNEVPKIKPLRSIFGNSIEYSNTTFTMNDDTQELANICTYTCDPGTHPYSDATQEPEYSFLSPQELEISKRLLQYDWEYPLDGYSISKEALKFENNPIDITEKILKFENDLTQIKNDLDDIKEAIMAINHKMDRY